MIKQVGILRGAGLGCVCQPVLRPKAKTNAPKHASIPSSYLKCSFLVVRHRPSNCLYLHGPAAVISPAEREALCAGIYHEGAPDGPWGRALAFWKAEVLFCPYALPDSPPPPTPFRDHTHACTRAPTQPPPPPPTHTRTRARYSDPHFRILGSSRKGIVRPPAKCSVCHLQMCWPVLRFPLPAYTCALTFSKKAMSMFFRDVTRK